MCINLLYCLVCPFFSSKDTRLCHGASKAPRTICQSVVLQVLLCMLALSMTSRRVQKWVSKTNFDDQNGVQKQSLHPHREASWTSKVRGRTNKRQDCSGVDAALKEDLQLFVFFTLFRPLAQAIRRSECKELTSFTTPKIGLQINQSTALRGLVRPGATSLLGMSSAMSTSSSITWTEEHHQKLQENGESYPDEATMGLVGPLTLDEKRRRSPNILQQVHQRRSAARLGQKPAQSSGGTMPPMSFNKRLILMKPNNKGAKNLICWTALAKAAVARRRRRAGQAIVDSQPRSWRSLTRR